MNISVFKKHLLRIVAGLAIMQWSVKAMAVCASPAGVDGQLLYSAGTLRFCNDTSWVNLNNVSTGVSCTAGEAGKIQYTSSELRYCNGTWWLRTAPTTNHGTCVAGSAGRFYYDTTGKYYWFCNGTNWRRMGP